MGPQTPAARGTFSEEEEPNARRGETAVARAHSRMAQCEPLRFRGLPRREIHGSVVPVAVTRRSRLLGLALIGRERTGAGLLIPRCRSVHTFGVRFALDLLFLDATNAVVELRRGVGPCRVARCAEAVAVLELPSP